MRQLSATRKELLARRSQIALATLGRDLLKRKRDALKAEFMQLGGSMLEAMESLDAHCGEGRRELACAVAADGPDVVESAAFAAGAEVEVGLVSKNIAGVQVVEVEKPPLSRAPASRGYSLAGSTPRVDRVASAFEAQLDLLLDVVARELSLRRLAEAIALTTRRVNALDGVVLPRLEAERDAIALVLEERERDDRARLRMIRGPGRRERVP